MSTKNLARTVIEGGRTSFNRFARRSSNATHRAQVREALTLEQRNENHGDVVFPLREPVYRCFDDKLAPAKRWLARQVGRPWDMVRSELFERFDTRTTPGRHIVFDHMLGWVETGVRVGFHSHPYFTVDAHGILRRAAFGQRYFYRHGYTPRIADWVLEWLGERRIGEREGHFYWFTPTAFGGYRQAHTLTASEVARYQSIPVPAREQLDPLCARVVGPNQGENSSWPAAR